MFVRSLGGVVIENPDRRWRGRICIRAMRLPVTECYSLILGLSLFKAIVPLVAEKKHRGVLTNTIELKFFFFRFIVHESEKTFHMH